jgi:hypothetical protein
MKLDDKRIQEKNKRSKKNYTDFRGASKKSEKTKNIMR